MMTTEMNIKDKQTIITTLNDILARAMMPINSNYESYLIFKESIKTLVTLLKETQ